MNIEAPKPVEAKKPKAAKPKAKKAPKPVEAKKPKAAKPKAKKAPKKKAAAVVSRPSRLDLRLTAAEKAKLVAKAAKLRRTVTSIVLEMVEKLK